MFFARTLAVDGATYFLCSLAYFLMGIVLAVELKRGSHRSGDRELFGLLCVFGFVRSLYHFGELFFLISFQRSSALQAGGVHELIWVAGDYLTVLVLFAYAWRLLRVHVLPAPRLRPVAAGLVTYWIGVILGARWLGLDFSRVVTWHHLKPFLICLPSFSLIVFSFVHLAGKYAQLGVARRAAGFRRLAQAYTVQTGLVLVLATLGLLIDGPVLRSLTYFRDSLTFLLAFAVLGTAYLLYLVVSSDDRQAESGRTLHEAEQTMASELGLHLVHQICFALEVDAAGVFTVDGAGRDGVPAQPLAVRGFPSGVLSPVTGENPDWETFERSLTRRYKTVVQVPISFEDCTLGRIVVANRRRRPLSPQDRRFLTALAQEAGKALSAVGELVEKVEARAMQEERLRISREMHDGLSPFFAYLRIKVELAKGLLEESDHNPLADTLVEIDNVIAEAFADVRESITGLRCTLESPSLSEGIRGSVTPFTRSTGIPVTMDVPDDLPVLPPKVEAHLLRIVQEALTNVRKHAQAERVQVAVTVGVDCLTLKIADDGRGFVTASAGDGHFGLSSMRERSAEIGAALDVASQPGQGTVITLVLPLRPRERRSANAESAGGGRPQLVPGRVGEPDLI